MKRTIKRILAIALVSALTVGMLGGCKSGKQEDSQGNKNQATGSQGAKEPSKADKTEAMGRYRETEISLPEDAKDNVLFSFIKGKDGNLELYSGTLGKEGEVSEFCRHIYKDGAWTKDKDWWGPSVMEAHGLNFNKAAYGMDGNYYVGGTDSDYVYHLYQVSEDGTAKEVLSDVFKPLDGSPYGIQPMKFSATSDGNILICDYKASYLYKPDGTKLLTMPQDFSGSTDSAAMFITDDEFVTILDGNLVRYSLADGQVKETIPFDELKSGQDGVFPILFSDQKGGIFLANERGLYHRNAGGTVWENIIDGSLNSMGMRSLAMPAFLEGDNQDYYGFFTGDMRTGMQLFHYTYDKDLASVPPVTLNVYALEDSSTVRQAASLLQKNYPEIKVEFRIALQEGQESMKEDVIRSLNTELLSGKGADVLVLDGLPAESYIQKGVLMNMGDIFNRIQKDNPLFTNITDGFVGKDGSVYEMPARFAFPVVMGNEPEIKAYSSLESMKSYQGKPALVPAQLYENLLRLVANLQYEELFGDGLSGLDEEKLTAYLETVKTLGEQSDSKMSFTKDEEKEAMIFNQVLPTGIWGSCINLDRGMSSSALEVFNSVFSMTLPWGVMDKHPDLKMEPVNGIYIPSTFVGINQSSQQKEAAEQFVETLFSVEVQGLDLNDGFPVVKEGLEGWNNIEKGSYAVGASTGDYELSADWPTKEKRTKVFDIIPLLKVPVTIDETVMGMIVSESKDYLEGKESAAQAASAISQKIKLYAAE